MSANFLLVVFVFLLLNIITSTASFSGEPIEKNDEITPEDALKMVNELIKQRKHNHPQHHHHHHRHKGYCGVKAVKKLEQTCPDLCSIEDDTLVTEMCSLVLSDSDIKNRCCPE